MVVDTNETQVEVKESVGKRAVKQSAAGVLLVTKPSSLFSSIMFRGQQQTPTQTHGVFIVRRPDGTQMQARIEGDLVGSIVSRGDIVSLWGRKRSGVLIVQRGYNHSVSAEIKIRSRR